MAVSGVVKVRVSFYRSGEDFAFEGHRSRVTFDLAKQSSVAAVKKHLYAHIHKLLIGHEND